MNFFFRKILSLPIIRKELRDIQCCDGDAVTLECKFYAPSETPIIRWEKDGKVIQVYRKLYLKIVINS